MHFKIFQGMLVNRPGNPEAEKRDDETDNYNLEDRSSNPEDHPSEPESDPSNPGERRKERKTTRTC